MLAKYVPGDIKYIFLSIYYWKCPEIWDFSSNVSLLAPKWTKMLKYAKKIIFINSIKHILAEYDEQICFEDRAEFHSSCAINIDLVIQSVFLRQLRPALGLKLGCWD
jgi:hypothetical protein